MRIHISHKTHLDLGYTDFAANVETLYFDRFIPDALATARKLRENDSPGRLCWTVPTYILHRYLEQASKEETRAVEEAVAEGEVSWLALPFTMHIEAATPALLREGFTYARELDERFGQTTIAAKVTDVPGLTVAAVPLLAEAGVELVYVGANGIDMQPEIPAACRWVAPDGSEVILLHTQGYGGTIAIDGIDDMLLMKFTLDNVGPPNVVDVMVTHLDLRHQYPDAEIFASSLNAFAHALRPHRDQLPVVEGELGDVWLFGTGSDPRKIARYREISRLLEEVEVPDDARRRASRALLMVPEHTWGLDSMVQLSDTEHWTKSDLRAVRGTKRWQRYESSWAEQRAYVDEALAALPGDMQALAAERLSALDPELDIPTAPDGPRTLTTARFELEVDGRGAIAMLRDRITGTDWAAADAPLALFAYQIFDIGEYEWWWQHGMAPGAREVWWPHYARGKAGLSKLGRFGDVWHPELTGSAVDGDRLVLRLRLPDAATERHGGPRDLVTAIAADDAAGTISVDLSWGGKDATREPEAAWLSFEPRVDPSTWRFEKLGLEIDPASVVPYGGHHHAADRVRAGNGDRDLRIVTLDAPLVSRARRIAGEPHPSDGVHFNLLNTVWGTNFPAWYDDDARFRFRVELGAG